VSDTQIPFEHEKALPFSLSVKKHYKVPDDNCIHIGDELDCYFGGRWPKDPDGRFSATGELAESKRRLLEWYKAFPVMMVCISNHGLRWVKKASAAEIPSQLMRSYTEIIEAPSGWVWKEEWNIPTKNPFRAIHGMGYSGQNGHRLAAIDAGISTCIGHLHSHAGISYVRTQNQRIFGFNVGCLIDSQQYAFSYGKESRFKPCLGVGIIAGSGSTPIWIPLE